MRSMYFMTWHLCLVCLLLHFLSVLFHEKFLRLTMGFGYFMYSHSLVPVIDLWFRVVTKLVSEQWFHCWSWNCRFVFSYTTAVIGCQMSVLSSLLLVICVVSVSWLCFDFNWLLFSEWEGEHEMLLLLKQLIILNSPFRAKRLLLLLDVKEEVAMVEEFCLMLYMFWAWFFFMNEIVGLIIYYLIARDV